MRLRHDRRGVATRVLVAGSDEDARHLLARTLRRGWFDVVAVADGLQALEELRSAAYDVAVLDAAMPGLDGFAVCRWVRGHGRDRTLPVLVLADGTHPGPPQDGCAAGVTDVLMRPFSPRLLRARVAAAVRPEPDQSAHPEPHPRAVSLVRQRNAAGR